MLSSNCHPASPQTDAHFLDSPHHSLHFDKSFLVISNIEKSEIPNLRPVSVWDWVIWLLPGRGRLSAPNSQFLTNMSRFEPQWLNENSSAWCCPAWGKQLLGCPSWLIGPAVAVCEYILRNAHRVRLAEILAGGCKWWPMSQMLPLSVKNLLAQSKQGSKAGKMRKCKLDLQLKM